METVRLYQYLAQCLAAKRNCQKSGNEEWLERWQSRIQSIESELLPCGSGIDAGCLIDQDACTDQRIVIVSSVHMMDENGFYDSWQDFRVIVRPSFTGIDLAIHRTGDDGNRRLWSLWLDDLYDQFQLILSERIKVEGDQVRFATAESI